MYITYVAVNKESKKTPNYESFLVLIGLIVAVSSRHKSPVSGLAKSKGFPIKKFSGFSYHQNPISSLLLQILSL